MSVKQGDVVDNQRRGVLKAATRKAVMPAAIATVWVSPLVQTVLLPVHAQTSTCSRADIPGRWQLELFGIASQSQEINLLDNGTAEHAFLNAWQFTDGTLYIIQGFTWALNGGFESCNVMSGSYTNTIVNPILGNIIIRRGEWRAVKRA